MFNSKIVKILQDIQSKASKYMQDSEGLRAWTQSIKSLYQPYLKVLSCEMDPVEIRLIR